ncbi:MAG: DUF3500 domain-containing protein [Verrucomicrobiales bacterium]|nr:DUF3500 domain-containing protein [Verrucomicrobiales bacterium]
MKLHLTLLAIPTLALAADHPSLTSEVFATYTPPAPADHAPATIATSAKTFLASLTDELRTHASLKLDDPERQKWTNVPPRGPQGGVRLGDCDKAQLQAAANFLRTTFSLQGYEKARNILLADDKLLRNGQPRDGFGAENYWLAIFGEPSSTGKWAIQLDGHHVAFNLTFHGDNVSMSPSFIGTQPAAFKLANKTITVMRGEDTGAFKLVQSLDGQQKNAAIVSPVRTRIATAAGKDGVVPDPVGVSCKTFNADQKKLLIRLLRQYTGDLPKPYAPKRLKALRAEIDQMKFAWSGPITDDSDVSYRIQGPTLIIEYACQDLGGNPRDHLHSMYRNPTNEYGMGQ